MKVNIIKLIVACWLTIPLLSSRQGGVHSAVPVVTWDKKSLMIDGRRVLPVMGEMHYARVPEGEWRHELQKMKAGGVTMVATYVFWIYHEDEVEGQWNWSGNRNLRHFVELCKEEGLPVVLRVGPFCHGEVYQGGLPCWLVRKSLEDKEHFRLRSLAPGFIDATEQLYQQIGKQVRGLMWKDGGPVIGVQLENECRGPWAYFMKLLELAHDAGLDAPFYTRTGWPKMNGSAEFGKILPLYGDYADGFWDRALTDMPGDYAKAFTMKDTRLSAVIATETFGTKQSTQMQEGELGYPYLTCELGGGMMPSYHRRLNMSGRETMPLCVCKLGSGSNLPGYYMYHGGTNPTSLSSLLSPLSSHYHYLAETQNSPVTNYNDLPVMSYDFQTILDEMGRPNPVSWHETRWVHQFLKDWGEELAAMPVDTLNEHEARRGPFVFRNDYVRLLNEQGSASITPRGMTWRGLTITSDEVQPFAKADGKLYFIYLAQPLQKEGSPVVLTINGRKHKIRLDRPITINGQTLTVLSREQARQAYVINGRMYFGDGILYQDGDEIMQEQWLYDTSAQVEAVKVKQEGPLREVPMGANNVAHQPEDNEFDAAAVWTLDFSSLTSYLSPLSSCDLFLEISYRGDCARVYADGQLVEDNFWNGKPMLVRMSVLMGKHVELKILPLGKDAPIYLQKEQRQMLDAATNYLLALDSVKILRRSRAPLETPNTIDLRGQWSFCMGEEPVLNDHITLPNSMITADKGDEVTAQTRWTGSTYDSSYYFNPAMERYRQEGNVKFPFFLTPRKHYVGTAWYERSITIPRSWKRQPVLLFLERPHIETTVYVNGHEVGHQLSLSTPHEYDITPFVRFGKTNTIRIRVYNGIENVGVGQDSHSVTDQTQGNWNGIVGRIELRQRAAPTIRVMPDIAARSVTIHVGGDSIYTFQLGDTMQLWSEHNPYLYTRQVCYHGQPLTLRFGIRDIAIRGPQFYLNGEPIWLRGTVENCCFPETGYPPTDEASWLRIFEKCREYGLNHMRFHSYCPPEAAFAAADKMGFYLQPEGPSWPNHGVKLRRGQVIDEYLLAESKRIIDAYGHHPSFVMMAAGNEPAGDWVSYCNDWVNAMKQYDPTKVYCGASVGGGWAWDSGSEYHVKGGARGLDWDKHAPHSDDNYFGQILFPRNYRDTVPNQTPIIAHEQGQWCAFPDFKEISQYTGAYKADNFEIFRDLLEKNGMASQSEKFLQASGKLQTLAYKYEIERNLRTTDYAGFQLLGLNDYSGQGTALVGPLNVHWNEKQCLQPDGTMQPYVNGQEWSEFCSQIVPLAQFPKFVYENTDTLVAPVELYNASGSPLSNACATYYIYDDERQEITHGELVLQWLPTGKDIPLDTIRIPLAGLPTPAKYTLSVTINSAEGKLTAYNHWNFWVYPAEEVKEAKILRIQDICPNTQTPTLGPKGRFRSEAEKEHPNSLEITDTLDQHAIDVLANGGDVLIMAAGKIRFGNDVVHRFLPVFWNTSWFKMRPPHTTGAYIQQNHPVFTDFPTDDWQDLQWWELVNNTQVMNLAEFPLDYQPIVQPIDTWHVSRKLGMLIEARVLNGRLLMTTIDLTHDLAHRPVARQLRKSILNYMQSNRFQPDFQLNPQVITNLFERIAPPVSMFTNDSPDELKPALQNNPSP